MASSSESIEYWRKIFRSADADIFEVMEQAILIAASDYPEEFRSRRDRVAEKLFTALLPRCYGCDRIELHGSEGEEGRGSVRRVGEKESKVDSSNGVPEFSNRAVSNYTYDEAEALTCEIEEEGQIVEEVLRTRDILTNHQDESDSVLFESLRRLQLMELSVDVLKGTEIGKAVNGLRKRNSKQIRHLARTLIEGWKVLVDEWVSATAAVADKTPDSLNPSVVYDEEGLPSPPLDEGALFAAQTASIQLSGFFDEIDDDGNFRNNWDGDEKWETGRGTMGNHEKVKNQQPKQQSIDLVEKAEMRREEMLHPVFIEENMRKQEVRQLAISEDKLHMRRQDSEMRPSKSHIISTTTTQVKSQCILSKKGKPAVVESGPGRPARVSSERKMRSEVKPKLPHDAALLQRKPPTVPQNKSIYPEDALVRDKLEIAKRKLHEGYQQAENAKKQRIIQVMELHDIPKQAHNNKPPFPKSKNHFRNWANVRH